MLKENKKLVFFPRVPGCASGSGLGLSSCCCAASDLSTSRRLADLVPHSCRGNLRVVAPHATSTQLSQLLVPTVCRFPTFPCGPPTPSPARSRLIPCRWLVTTFIPFKLTQAFVFLRAPPVDKKKKTLFRADKLDCSQLFPSHIGQEPLLDCEISSNLDWNSACKCSMSIWSYSLWNRLHMLAVGQPPSYK